MSMRTSIEDGENVVGTWKPEVVVKLDRVVSTGFRPLIFTKLPCGAFHDLYTL